MRIWCAATLMPRRHTCPRFRSSILNREQVISDGQGLSVRKVSPFRAVVAFYPYGHPLSDPDTPLCVLTGRKDDACPVSLNSSLKKDYARTKYEFSLKIYPGAYHAFDLEALKGGIILNGHHFEFDARATSDAITRTKTFLAKYIGARESPVR